jgi:hypothetical protein
MRAAALYNFNEPFKIEKVELQEPQQGEVTVELAASGVCHSEEAFRFGACEGLRVRIAAELFLCGTRFIDRFRVLLLGRGLFSLAARFPVGGIRRLDVESLRLLRLIARYAAPLFRGLSFGV